MAEKELRAEVKLVKNAAGILVPEDTIKPDCPHAEVAKRVVKSNQRPRYHCKDCNQKVNLITIQFAIMTDEAFETFQGQMKQADEERIEKQRRAKVGLVLPGEQEAK